MLIVNADDLGRTREATDSILSCFRQGQVTSASIMVFMSDSERAAESALAADLESGLHLNLDLPFNSTNLSPRLMYHHMRIVRYLNRCKWAQVSYNPSLKKAFRNIFDAQYDEYCCLFGKEPTRIDGHHHMHLCMNMVMDRIIPPRIYVRRNFTFAREEKNVVNRLYRKLIDAWLTRRYFCIDAFYGIEPVWDLCRLKEIVSLACSQNVELMTHPAIREQYEFLQSLEYRTLIQGIPMGNFRML